MLSNTWDARRSYFVAYLLTFMLYKAYSCYQNDKRNNILSLKIGRCVEHPKIYKVLQRGYIS